MLNSEIALFSGNWASRPITNSVVLNKLCCANQRRKVSFATETFLYDKLYRMLKCNFLYSGMLKYVFLSYEYIFSRS